MSFHLRDDNDGKEPKSCHKSRAEAGSTGVHFNMLSMLWKGTKALPVRQQLSNRGQNRANKEELRDQLRAGGGGAPSEPRLRFAKRGDSFL